MSVRDAVIVSTARTPIGRAYKGAFNATAGATLGSGVIMVLDDTADLVGTLRRIAQFFRD